MIFRMAMNDFDQPGVEPRVVFPSNIDRRRIVMEPECSCPGIGQHLKRYTGEEASLPIGGDCVKAFSENILVQLIRLDTFLDQAFRCDIFEIFRHQE